MKKINFQNLFINISLLLYVIVCCVRYYVDNLVAHNITFIIMIVANMLLIFNMIASRKIKINSKKYFIVALLLYLPSLYKNAYIADHIFLSFAYYFLSISYSILLCFSNVKKSNIEFVIKLFIIFAFMTGIVTWISIFSPNFYIKEFIPLMPSNLHDELILNFTIFNNRMGLTSHYSRNAFFIMLGIIGSLYFYFENKSKFSKLSIIFLLLTMLVVGKRGHFIFLVFSLIIAYFIINKVNIKTIAKFFGIIFIFSMLIFSISKFVPEVNYTFERIFSEHGSDVSNGRFEMYKDIFSMFQRNGYVGIGWNKYASNTRYVHPGVHNDYIQLLCETGIIGFLIVIGANIYILKVAIKYTNKKRNSISFIILTYNIFFMMYSFTGLPHYDVDTYMFYFLINSILFYIDSREIEFNKVNYKKLN